MPGGVVGEESDECIMPIFIHMDVKGHAQPLAGVLGNYLLELFHFSSRARWLREFEGAMLRAALEPRNSRLPIIKGGCFWGYWRLPRLTRCLILNCDSLRPPANIC